MLCRQLLCLYVSSWFYGSYQSYSLFFSRHTRWSHYEEKTTRTRPEKGTGQNARWRDHRFHVPVVFVSRTVGKLLSISFRCRWVGCGTGPQFPLLPVTPLSMLLLIIGFVALIRLWFKTWHRLSGTNRANAKIGNTKSLGHLEKTQGGQLQSTEKAVQSVTTITVVWGFSLFIQLTSSTPITTRRMDLKITRGNLDLEKSCWDLWARSLSYLQEPCLAPRFWLFSLCLRICCGVQWD